MYELKQGINQTLRVNVQLPDGASVESAVFKFTQVRKKVDPLKLSVYGDGGSVAYEGGVFMIPFSAADTYLFNSGSLLYMDS